MLNHIFRGIITVIAIMYAAISTGLSQAAYEDASVQSMLPTQGVIIEPVQETVVHVLQSREEIGFKLQRAFELYGQAFSYQPSFSVQTIASEADYHSTLRAKLLSGESVDLFMISGARELNELKNNIYELSFLSWATNAGYGAADAVTNDDKIYGIPYCIESFGLICNRNIFEAAEIPLDEIRSFDDINDAFVKIRDNINAGEFGEEFAALNAVCDFPARDKAFLGGGFADIALTGTFDSNAQAASALSVVFSSPDSAEDLIKLMAWFSANSSDWPKLAKVTYKAQVERFANVNIAAMLGDTNVYSQVNKLNPKLQGRLYLMPVPLKNFEQSSIYRGVPAYWVINSASDEKTKEAAGAFLTWLYRSNEGAQYFADEFGLVSPYQDTAKSTGVALHSQMLGYLRTGAYLPQLHAEFPVNWGRDVFSPNVQSYFTERQKTWAEVVKANEDGWHR